MPQYDPTPPAENENVDLSNYQLSICKVTEDHNKKSWDRYSIKISPETRSRWIDDPVFGTEWRSLLMDFDAKFLVEMAKTPITSPRNIQLFSSISFFRGQSQFAPIQVRQGSQLRCWVHRWWSHRAGRRGAWSCSWFGFWTMWWRTFFTGAVGGLVHCGV